MKIYNHPNVPKATKVYEKNSRSVGEPNKSAASVKDSLELSQNAKEFQVALAAFQKLPEIREEKVNAIREQVRQGTYQVSGKEIVDKILEGIHINQKI